MDKGRGLRPEIDAGAPTDAWFPTDVPLPTDARLVPDAQVPPDLLAPAVGCAALQPLADGVLTSRHAVRALFAPDRGSLALRVKGEDPSGGSVQDDLLLVQLPSGKVSPIISSITSAEWLRPGATLLVKVVREGKEDLVVVGADGGGVRTLVQGVCDHVAAPDGSRVYVLRDCDEGWLRTGAMEVVDVASGASMRLAVGVFTGRTVVSPDGRWVAFMTTTPSDGGSSKNALVVGGAGGQIETLSSQPGASNPWFLSESLLLFQGSSGIRGHVPGTGDTSYLLAANRDPGLHGYQVSPDRTRLLGATRTTAFGDDDLYAIRLDGTGELLLASDAFDFWSRDFGPRVFAFSAGGRVIYNTSHDFGVATVGLDGGTSTALSASASFLETPRLDQVALFEGTMLMPTSRLRLVDLETGTDVFAYDSDGEIWTIGFLPSDDGLVFTEWRSPGPSRLRYASAERSLVLGEWQSTQFTIDSSSDPRLNTYPVDPTGCFTVFDTDLAPRPGTRLAILPQ